MGINMFNVMMKTILIIIYNINHHRLSAYRVEYDIILFKCLFILTVIDIFLKKLLKIK